MGKVVMGRVLLVRHGQASFGTDDYDVLSEAGREQAALVGRALAVLRPDVVVHGSLRRQRETAEIAAAAAGWTCPISADERWDEFELAGTASRMATRDADGPRAFQAWFKGAMDRWLAGEHEQDDESWDAFHTRTTDALAQAATHPTAVVISSGGPISSLTASLVDGGASAHRRLMPVMVNASVTKVVSGRRGLSLVSFNAHDHLPAELVTYR